MRLWYSEQSGFGMHAGDGKRGLTAMFGLLADGIKKQRPGGDSFGVFSRNGQSSEHAPPVFLQVVQRHAYSIILWMNPISTLSWRNISWGCLGA